MWKLNDIIRTFIAGTSSVTAKKLTNKLSNTTSKLMAKKLSNMSSFISRAFFSLLFSNIISLTNVEKVGEEIVKKEFMATSE